MYNEGRGGLVARYGSTKVLASLQFYLLAQKSNARTENGLEENLERICSYASFGAGCSCRIAPVKIRLITH